MYLRPGEQYDQCFFAFVGERSVQPKQGLFLLRDQFFPLAVAKKLRERHAECAAQALKDIKFGGEFRSKMDASVDCGIMASAASR